MKILSLILACLALAFCLYLHSELRLIKYDIKRIEKDAGTERFIYNISPKKQKPGFGRVNQPPPN
jgi:hypothetical protein